MKYNHKYIPSFVKLLQNLRDNTLKASKKEEVNVLNTLRGLKHLKKKARMMLLKKKKRLVEACKKYGRRKKVEGKEIMVLFYLLLSLEVEVLFFL